MSDNWLQFIPADPELLPSREAAERARALLSSFAPRAPAGFSRFVLEAENPDVVDLAPDEVAQLRAALGCELRRIWKHL